MSVGLFSDHYTIEARRSNFFNMKSNKQRGWSGLVTGSRAVSQSSVYALPLMHLTLTQLYDIGVDHITAAWPDRLAI